MILQIIGLIVLFFVACYMALQEAHWKAVELYEKGIV